jgi:CRISPR/Cas system CSM-associated protein Csm3 (group 7 of RAMP superfamily)
MEDYNITICLKSNLYIGSGFGFARIVDLVSIKDEEGLVYIPASTIKGKLKSVCRKIAKTLKDDPCFSQWKSIEGKICGKHEGEGLDICMQLNPQERCVICRLFGSPYTEGKLIFGDAELDESQQNEFRLLHKISRLRVDKQSELRNGVKISRKLHISSPQALFSMESVSKELAFIGTINAKELLDKQEKDLLIYGLKILTHIGGQKARGLGRIESICCEELGLECRRLANDE